MKKIISYFLVIALFASLWIGFSQERVCATTTEQVKFTSTMTIAYNMYPYEFKAYSLGKKIKGAKKIKIKSSNKKVLQVNFTPGNDAYVPEKSSYSDGWFLLNPLKKGSAKVTITFKNHGKKYKLSSRVYTCKYKNPVKKFKIRKKNIAKKFKKRPFYQSKIKFKKKDKVSIKAKKGWKIKKITLGYFDIKKGNFKRKKIKNNKKFKAKKDADIYVVFYNKRMHQYVTVDLRYK